MNSVPFAFCDVVTRYFNSNNLSACSELCGLIGAAASEIHERSVNEFITIHNGRLVRTHYRTWNFITEIASISENCRRCTWLDIRGTDEEQSTDAETIRAFTANRNELTLFFYTSKLSKQLEECIYSLRFLSVLYFNAGSAGLIPRLLQKFVQKRTLGHVWFGLDYKIDTVTTALLLELLKQEHFRMVSLPAGSTRTLKKIIAEWKTDSKKFSGKAICCGMTSEHPAYRKAIKKGNIRECTESEKRFLNFYHPNAVKSSLISTNRIGDSIYWHCDEKQEICLGFA